MNAILPAQYLRGAGRELEAELQIVFSEQRGILF